MPRDPWKARAQEILADPTASPAWRERAAEILRDGV